MSASVDYCTPLPDGLRYHDPNGMALKDELLHAITSAVKNSDRSLQKMIGPSEIGAECTRLLGYKLLGIPERERVAAWKAAVGTGGHMLMEEIFDRYNLANAQYLDGQERFYIETRVNVGEVNGVPITGSSDVYDRVTGTVIDWKFPGPSMLEKYRRKGPGRQYRAQGHLYGRGWVRAGLPVSRVMIAFLPRHGELDDHYIWTEEYDEQVALDALQRLEGVDHAAKAVGTAALQLLPTSDQYCHLCPYLKRHSTNLEEGCPGDPAARMNASPATQLAGMVSPDKMPTSTTRQGALI